MKKIYLTVRSNYDSWVVTAMEKMNSERFIFSQMSERYLEGERGHFKLDFEYAPKGEYVGEMSRRGSKPLHIYQTSLQELRELAEIEKRALERMATRAMEVEKEREDYFRKNNAMLQQEDMAGGEGGEYV